MTQIATAIRDRARLADWIELTKPGITTMVVITAAVGYWMGLRGSVDPVVLFHVLAGTSLSSAGACSLNMVFEREGDARMRRTRNRPIPAGRIRPIEALLAGVALAASGVAWLWMGVGPLAGVLSLAICVGYLFAYTPLKPVSSVSTLIGAQFGAAPPLIGWVAARGGLDPGAWAIFALIVCWQWPHILSMAWMNRRDYIEVDYPMAPVFEGSGGRAAAHMLIGLLTLTGVSLLPFFLGMAGLAYLVPAVVLGVAFSALGVVFARRRTDSAARRVFLSSLLYLPLILAALVAGKL